MLAYDARKARTLDGFSVTKRAEESYARNLRRIARYIGDVVKGFAPDGLPTIDQSNTINAALARYSDALTPWATSVAGLMLKDVERRNTKAWESQAAEMGRALGREIREAPTGLALQKRLSDQVTLIKSIPKDAGERVHALTLQSLETGARADEIAREILRTQDVSASRATLIARTEVSRTGTDLTRVRAEYIGSTHFEWVTSHDGDVRPSHKRLSGTVHRWDDPPECDPGHHALPGAIWNCRCRPRPIIPD